MATRQQLEQQLVAAHRSGNVQAAQQAAYNIRAYDTAIARGGSGFDWNVPSVNAPPPIERVPKPTFGSWLENVGIGIGEGLGEQVQGIGELAQRGASALGAYAKDPLKASAAAFMGALAPAMRGFTQPAQVAKDVGAGVVETGKQMYQQATSGPVGLGTVIGQNLDLPGPGGQRRPTMAELDVYHGTPHTFEPEEGAPLGRFRSEKIGTGEGAQAYGYGMYFAESPDVAGEYRDRLSTKVSVNGSQLQTIPSDSPLANAHNMVVTNVQRGLSPKDAIAATKKYWTDAANEMLALVESHPELAERIKKEASGRMEIANSAASLKPESFYRHPGSLYKVDLPDAKTEQMLDWDKPLSEQPESVRKALQNHPAVIEEVKRINEARLALNEQNPARLSHPVIGKLARKETTADSLKGSAIYELLAKGGNQPQASEYLRSLGIPGIKYLDAGSRAGEKGTRNFVVFPGEEQNLTILERNGVKAEVPKPDELAYHGTTKQAAAAIEREGFDLTRAADGTVWFTSNPNIGEVAATGKGGIVARSVSGLKLGGWDEMDKYSTDELIAKGYDGLRLKDGDEITYQIFNPEKLKVPTKKAK